MTITQIVNRIYRLTHTNSTSYVAANMLDDINVAYNRVVSLVIKADGRWQFDDSNNTDFPMATTALVSGQNDYALSTAHLRITDIELKLSTGIWQKLLPVDEKDIESPSYEQTITGIPYRYDKLANSIILYPTPNYSQTASLKIWYARGPAEFTSAEVTTGTKTPGFNSLYHDLIPLWVAYDYWMMNDPTMTTRILEQINMKEKALKADYGMRDKDDLPQISMAEVNFM